MRAPGGKTFAVPGTKRRVFYEPFSHTTYTYVASFSGEAREGVYELGVTGHGKARFTLVVGNRETGGVVEGESPQSSDALAKWWSGSVKLTGSGGGK